MNKKIVSRSIILVLLLSVPEFGIVNASAPIHSPPICPGQWTIYDGESTTDYVVRYNGSHTLAYDRDGQVAFRDREAATVLNNAIAATLLSGGGKIVIRRAPDAYELGDKLRILGSNLVLKADRGTILKQVADMDSMLCIGDDTGRAIRDIRITGLTFDGSTHHVSNPFRGLIWVKNAEAVVLNKLEVTHSGMRENYTGNRLVPQSGIHVCDVHQLLIANSYVHHNQGSGVTVSSTSEDYSNEIYIIHNRIIWNAMSNVTGAYAGINMRAQDFYVTSNYIYRARFGIQISGDNTRNGHIERNVFVGNAGDEQKAESGIEIWSEGVSQICIRNNYFAKWCYEEGGGGAGVEIGNVYSSFVGDGAHHNEIAGNIIDAGGYADAMVTYGITLNGKYNKVHHNIILNPNTAGIREFGVSEFNEIYANRIILARNWRCNILSPSLAHKYQFLRYISLLSTTRQITSFCFLHEL